MREECGVPLLVTNCQTAEVIFDIRGVTGHEIEVLKFGSEDAPLVVGVAEIIVVKFMLRFEALRQTRGNRERLNERKDGGAGVARLIRRVPELVVTLQRER